jgi:hypothetical protein
MLRKNNLEKTLREMGKTAYQTEDGWTVVEADHPVHFRIDPTPALLKKSVRRSGSQCVVAKGLRRALGAPGLDFVVGAGLTKVLYIDKKIEVQFSTPRVLAKHLKVFDEPTGDWGLPPDLYRLLPLPKSWRIRAVKKTQRAKAAAKKKAAGKKAAGVAGTNITVGALRSKARCTRKSVTRVIVRRSRLKKLGSRAA